MRTLFEIIDSAKDGQKPTHDECYWAMLALEALLGFDHRALYNCAVNSSPLATKLRESESALRLQKAFEKAPDEWVGPNNDPSNPEFQRMRAAGKKLIEAFAARHPYT